MDYVPAGTPTSAQTTGDCKLATCDGAGHIVQVANPTDPPASTPCVFWSCLGALAAPTAAPEGTACLVNSACLAGTCIPNTILCGDGQKDGSETDIDCGGPACSPCADGKHCLVDADCGPTGSCVGGLCTGSSSSGSSSSGGPISCTKAADCSGPDDPCAYRSCINGVCGIYVVPAGASWSTEQTDGDCKLNTCDGAGNVVQVADPTDAPLLPPISSLCSAWTCNGMTPVPVYAPDGTTCPSNGTCQAGFCKTAMSSCPSPVASSPATTWADCSVGFDPTKNGGDLLWAQGVLVYPGCEDTGDPSSFDVGPTGDVVVAGWCYDLGSEHMLARRFNGSGINVGNYAEAHGLTAGGSPIHVTARLSRHNDLATFFDVWGPNGYLSSLNMGGPFSTHWQTWLTGEVPDQPSWATDGVGNLFTVVSTRFGMTLDSHLSLPAPPGAPFSGPVSYLVRGGAMGESYQADFKGSFLPDEAGGVYRFDALPSTLDLGCGPLVPSSASDTYLARFDSAWNCVFARVLPATVTVDAVTDGTGDVILTAASTASLDLGCGALPAAPSGSLFVTRLDAGGGCGFARSFTAPALKVTADPSSRVMLSGVVFGGAPVDLGGGALVPLGNQDFVLGVLDGAGNHLWSKRFGGLGVNFTNPRVSVSASGDIYVLISGSGTVDFGGGPIPGTATVVASFSPSGAHRWSRAFSIDGAYQSFIDGCGGLVVTSTDSNFDVGCGKLIPPRHTYPYGAPHYFPEPNAAVARYQP
ncbi:MAG: hypothetical protein QM820_56095 [Minicystis sp.]